MNKLLVALAAAGLLLSASARAQNTTTDTQKSTTPSATTNTQAKPDANTGELQNDRHRTDVKVNTDRSRRTTEERHERRGRVSTHGRSTVGINVRERDEYRHRHYRGIRAEVLVGHRHCRNVIVKKRYQHHVVIRHIRRCF